MKKFNAAFLVLALLALATYPSIAANTGLDKKIMVQPAGQMQVMEVDDADDADDFNDEDDSDENENDDSSGKLGADRNTNAREHMSTVASEVEGLLAMPDRQGGIGQQVRVIAQEQHQVQEEVQTQLGQLEDRPGLVRALIGPNHRAMDNIQTHVERNQERIEKLLALQEGALYPTEKAEVSDAVAALEMQNELLLEKLQQEQSTPSAFGWFFRLFN